MLETASFTQRRCWPPSWPTRAPRSPRWKPPAVTPIVLPELVGSGRSTKALDHPGSRSGRGPGRWCGGCSRFRCGGGEPSSAGGRKAWTHLRGHGGREPVAGGDDGHRIRPRWALCRAARPTVRSPKPSPGLTFLTGEPDGAPMLPSVPLGDVVRPHLVPWGCWRPVSSRPVPGSEPMSTSRPMSPSCI